MNLNWGAWVQGAISAVANGVITALGVSVIVPAQASMKQLAGIAVIPAVISFFQYIKQTPPPIGGGPSGNVAAKV